MFGSIRPRRALLAGGMITLVAGMFAGPSMTVLAGVQQPQPDPTAVEYALAPTATAIQFETQPAATPVEYGL